MFETVPFVMPMLLFGGLYFPKIAGLLGLAYSIGSHSYLAGYADPTKDVKAARYTRPLAALKPLA